SRIDDVELLRRPRLTTGECAFEDQLHPGAAATGTERIHARGIVPREPHDTPVGIVLPDRQPAPRASDPAFREELSAEVHRVADRRDLKECFDFDAVAAQCGAHVGVEGAADGTTREYARRDACGVGTTSGYI